MLKQIRPAIMMLVTLTIITGIIYPLGMTGLAQLLFPRQAGGSLVEKDGKVIGSTLIGQNFSDPRYFWGRPSATTDTDPADSTKTVAAPYNAQNSVGANLGPTSKALIDRVTQDSQRLQADNPDKPIPVDLATASASGLDPDITPAAAEYQVLRVAKTRHMSVEHIRQIVAENTAGRTLGIIGEPTVNVLTLNLALDAAQGSDKK
jgi:potassium-transporting ATPase KdpC subunit